MLSILPENVSLWPTAAMSSQLQLNAALAAIRIVVCLVTIAAVSVQMISLQNFSYLYEYEASLINGLPSSSATDDFAT